MQCDHFSAFARFMIDPAISPQTSLMEALSLLTLLLHPCAQIIRPGVDASC
jgi:hypothetical protein